MDTLSGQTQTPQTYFTRVGDMCGKLHKAYGEEGSRHEKMGGDFVVQGADGTIFTAGALGPTEQGPDGHIKTAPPLTCMTALAELNAQRDANLFNGAPGDGLGQMFDAVR